MATIALNLDKRWFDVMWEEEDARIFSPATMRFHGELCSRRTAQYSGHHEGTVV